MPLIDELPVDVTSAFFAADYLAQRSPGPHLKAIIDDYLVTHDLAPRKANPEFAAEGVLDRFAALGFGWERAAIAAISAGKLGDVTAATPESIVRVYEHVFSRALNAGWQHSHREVVSPGETTYDGIHCTADGANTRLRCGEEFKCTWSSAAHSLDEAHPDWMMQMPGYAHAYGWDTVILRVFHVNGYYERGGRMGIPVMRFYRLRWTAEERAENWSVVKRHQAVMQQEGRL